MQFFRGVAYEMSVATRSDWPVSKLALHGALEFVRSLLKEPKPKLLLVPDKDVDGLCGAMILHRTLTRKLRFSEANIVLHFLRKGENVHDSAVKDVLEAYGATHTVVVDMGSRGGPALCKSPTLIIDHHQAWDGYPEGAQILSSWQSEPVVPASSLCWLLAVKLCDRGASEVAWLAQMGVQGDLGPSGLQLLEQLFDGMDVKRSRRKDISEAVSLINARNLVHNHRI